MPKNQNYNIVGKRFGKLLVLSKGESKGSGRTAWVCRCDCGNKKTIRSDTLKNGSAKSCGSCNKSEQAMRSLFIMVSIPISEVCKSANKSGLTFGQYVAKEYTRRVIQGG